jgi:hypothetical protein
MANNYCTATLFPEIPLTEDQYTALTEDCFVEEDLEAGAPAWVHLQREWVEKFELEAEYSQPIIRDIYKTEEEGVYYIYFENGVEQGVPELLQEILRGLPDKYTHLEIEGSISCSVPRSGEFGGFAIFITRDDIKQITTNEWLYERRQEIKN